MNEDTVTVVLPAAVVRWYAAQDSHWWGDNAGATADACRAALDRPSLPEGTPQVGWSMDGYPLVEGEDIPEGWERRHRRTGGEWRSRSGPDCDAVYAVRPAPAPAVERIPAQNAVAGGRTVVRTEPYSLTGEHITAASLRLHGGLCVFDSDNDRFQPVAIDGTVEVLALDGGS